MPPSRVDALQRWLFEQIRHPGAANADGTAHEILTPSSQLSSQARLAIYQSAYVARLLECLQAEFPATAALVGDAAFADLARGYLEAHPSRSYTLGQLGLEFADFLQTVRPDRADDHLGPDFGDLLIETARLERLYSEVFDGPGPEALPALETQQLAPTVFASARLAFHECVRLVRLSAPVHLLVSAVRRGEGWAVPEPAETFLVVTRREFVVRRFEVSADAYRVLSLLRTGHTVGAALAEVFADRPDIGAQDLEQVTRWFRDWTAAPLFREVGID